MKNNHTKGIVLGGIIAALYTVLTYFAAMLNLAPSWAKATSATP